MNEIDSIVPDTFQPTLTKEELKLIWLMRTRFQYGELHISVKGGNPYYVNHVREGFHLSVDNK